MIGTKAGRTRPSRGDWTPCGRPEYLEQQAELSLRRLKVERLELFQLHRVDPLVPLADQVGALKELRDAGKVRHVGLSEVSIAEIEQARSIVEIASVQNLYNIHDRRHHDVLAYCEENQIAFIAWLPLSNGRSSGEALEQVARETGATRTQVALAWLLARSPVMVPIPGTKSAVHLKENLAAAALELTPGQVALLSA